MDANASYIGGINIDDLVDLVYLYHGTNVLHTQRALAVWTLDPAERDAQLANEATKMLTANNYVLLEIGCTRSSYHLFKVRETYHLHHKKSLEEDVAHHTSGDYRKVSNNFLSK